MTSFRIEFEEWGSGEPGQDIGRVPRFRVLRGEESLFVVDAELAGLARSTLLGQSEGDTEAERRLDDALLRWAVRRIEAGLAAVLFPMEQTLEVQVIRADDDDLTQLDALRGEKTCIYQVREERDLLCSAAGPNDETAVGAIGIRHVAPTSRPICGRCDLPDTDVICSNLAHPAVFAIRAMGGVWERQVAEALCEKGRDEIVQPGGCRAGSHPCWERVVEPEAAVTEPAVSPLSLPEQLDFLDAVWRVAFGEPLLQVRPTAHVAGLALGCVNRDEFKARMSDLADALDGMNVRADLLPADQRSTRGALRRLELALLGQDLCDENKERVSASIATLHGAVRIRVGLQHGDATKVLPQQFSMLHLAYPPADWATTWAQVKARVIDALAVLRDEIRRLAYAPPSE